MAAIADEGSGLELNVLTNLAQGAASLGSGQLELGVNRRTAEDDSRGVAENIDETMCGCRPSDNDRDCDRLTIRWQLRSGVRWRLPTHSSD